MPVLSSLTGLHMLKSLNFSYCNSLKVPESIGGLSCLKELNLSENDFSSLPGSLSQLSHLERLVLQGCKKLEVLPELSPSLLGIYASDCTSLREVSGSSKNPFRNRYNQFMNCPKLFKNVTTDSHRSVSKTECLDSSMTSKGFIHQLSAFLGYLGFQTNRCEFFFRSPRSAYVSLDIRYRRNSIPGWFTNRSTENHVKVELPLDWCFNKFKGYGTCVVFKCRKPGNFKGYYVKNFDGASLTSQGYFANLKNDYLKDESIWLHCSRDIRKWEEAKNFVTFCFEDVEVKECGVRLIYDEDFTNLSMFRDLPPLSQHGGAISLAGPYGYSRWTW